ncbi:MAG: 4Fe-4S binding protein [Planctomycetota bacterium]
MNILSNRLKRMILSTFFIFIIQLVFVAFLLLIIIGGLFGNIYRNINTWLVIPGWMVFITLLILISGKTWCLVCPWNTMALWLQRLKFFGRTNNLFSLNLKWIAPFRNMWLASVLLVIIIGLEYVFNMTDSPRLTAYIALIILAAAIISALLFERQSFCRYVCPVGAVSGVYSMLSPLELRSADKDACQKCATKDCIKGNDRGYACPVFEYPGRMDTSLYCILCTECIRTCPKDNIAVNIRSPFSELAGLSRSGEFPPVSDRSEIWMIVLLLVMSLFGAVSLSPRYQAITVLMGQWLGFNVGISLIFSSSVLLGIILFMLINYGFRRAAYAIIPLTLFFHLANTVKLVDLRGAEIVALISDPFGLRWNLFGTAGYLANPLMAPATLWYINTALIALGIIVALWLAIRMRIKAVGLLGLLIFALIAGYFHWILI